MIEAGILQLLIVFAIDARAIARLGILELSRMAIDSLILDQTGVRSARRRLVDGDG